MCLEQRAWTSGPVCSEGERGGEAHIRFLASSSWQQLGGWRIGRWGREMGSLGRASLRKPGGIWSRARSLDAQAWGTGLDTEIQVYRRLFFN